MKPINFDPSPTENAYDKIKEFMDSADDNQFKEDLNKAIDVVEDCFKKYKQENVSVCFNGGKDCIVMLQSLLSSLIRPSGLRSEKLAASKCTSYQFCQ